jgi:copper chaperone CopZ
MTATTIEIVNLKCHGCVNTVKKGILSLNGINDVDINLEKSKITVPTIDEIVLENVKEKLSKMGYPEIHDANTMLHKAKSFVSCATGRISIEKN